MRAHGGTTTVTIVVVGDPLVGKTSLITAAATDCFSDNPPPLLPPSRIPGESSPESVPLTVLDTSSRPEDRPALEATLKRADVIVLAFDLSRPATLERCGSYWMGEFRQLAIHVPVILVGCKSDLRSLDQELHQIIISIVSSNKQIEMCLECSAKSLQFNGEVFYYALKSVINPIGPLFDPESATIKPLCVRALKRVFMLSDKDRDSLLSDDELRAFQQHCFHAPLTTEELTAVKQVVKEKVPQGITSDGSLTFQGFLFLHALFIERGRTETPWAVLRTYGYDNYLKLSDELLDAVSFKRAPDQVVELTAIAMRFLTDVFITHAGSANATLSKTALDTLFSTAPSSPWSGRAYERLLVQRDAAGGLTLEGFLAQWVYTTTRDPRKMLAYFHYLGYEGDVQQLFTISKPRKQERRQATDTSRRTVFEGIVIGAPGCGQAALLRGLVKGGTASTQHRPNPSLPTTRKDATEASPSVSVSRVQGNGLVDGGSKGRWLILREYDDASTALLLEGEAGQDALQSVDVAAFVFDSCNGSSFQFAANMMETVAMASGDSLPCVFVAAKDDVGMSMDLMEATGSVCLDLGLPPPLSLSTAGGVGSVYEHILEAAVDGPVPATQTLKAQRRYRRLMRRLLIYGAATGVTLGCVYAVYQVYYLPLRNNSKVMKGSEETVAKPQPKSAH